MDNSRSTGGPPTGPRRARSPPNQRHDRKLPPWQQTNQGQRNRNRSRSPYGGHRDDRRRERSPDQDGACNRDRARGVTHSARLDYDGKTKRRGRRGSTSSFTSDKPLYRQELESSRAKQSAGSGSSSGAVLIEDHTPLTGDVNWDVDPAELQRVLGITKFDTTKETKVPGNDRLYMVSKTKKSEYRQYMNRVGGFNRPLSPTRGNQFAKPADTSGIET